MLHCPRKIMRTVAYSGIFLATASCSPGLRGRSDRRLAGGRRRRQHPGRPMQRQHVGRGRLGEDPGRPRHQQSRCLKAEQADARHADPDRHEEEARRRCNGKAKSTTPRTGRFYSSTIKPVGTDQLEIQGCVLGFLCGGETWTRVGPPIPSSPPTAWPRARRRPEPPRRPRRHRRPLSRRRRRRPGR